MSYSVKQLRDMLRNAPAGGTLLVAPDVYKAMHADNAPQREQLIRSGQNTMGIEVKVVSSMKPGTAIIMNGGPLDLPPMPITEAPLKTGDIHWADQYLRKSGPVGGARAPVVTPPPAPPPPASVPVRKPGPRRRIIDT